MNGWGWIWWAVGTFGVGGILLIGAGLFFGWPIVIGSRLGRAMIAVLAAIAAAFTLRAKWRGEGAKREREKQREASDRNRGIAREERERSEARTGDEISERLKGRKR
jgi:hypothetical protein